MLRQRPIARITLLCALLVFTGLVPYGTAHAEVRAYARIGLADQHMSRYHFSLGMTVCADLGGGVLMGAGFTRLVERCDEETGVGFLLAMNTAGHCLRWSIGYAMIDLRYPMPGSRTPSYLASPRLSYFVSAEVARRLTDRIAVQIRYQWNTADRATHERGYPRHRVSLGVEATL